LVEELERVEAEKERLLEKNKDQHHKLSV